MLHHPTPFPHAGSHALLSVTDTCPSSGRSLRLSPRRVRIQQALPGGRYMVTADAARIRIGNRMVNQPVIQRTVDRRELRPAS